MTTVEREPITLPAHAPAGPRRRPRGEVGVVCAIGALGVSISPVIGAPPGGDEAEWMGLATFLDFAQLTDVVIKRQVGLGRWLPLEALMIGGIFNTFTSTWTYKLLMYVASVSALVYAAYVGTRYVRRRWALPIAILALVPVVQLRTYHDGVGQYFAVMPALLALLSGIVHQLDLTQERGLTRVRIAGLVVLAAAAALLSNLTIFVLPALLLACWLSDHDRRGRIVSSAAIGVPVLISGLLTYVLRRRASTPYPIEASPWDIAGSTLREAWSVTPFSYVRSEGWSRRADFDTPSNWWTLLFAILAFVTVLAAFSERPAPLPRPHRRALVLCIAGAGLIFLPALGVSLSGQHQRGTLGVGYIEVTLGYGGVAWVLAAALAHMPSWTRPGARSRAGLRAATVLGITVIFAPVAFATFRNNSVAIDNFWAHGGARELADSYVAELVFENQREPELATGLPFLSRLVRGYFPERWDDQRTREYAGVTDEDLTDDPTKIVTGTAEPRVTFALVVPDESEAPAEGDRPDCTVLWWADDETRVAAVQVIDRLGITYELDELARDGRSHLAVAPPETEGCAQLQFARKEIAR